MSEVALIIAPVRSSGLATIARAAGIHPSYLSDLLAGRCQPRQATLGRIRLAVARLKSRQVDGDLDATATFRATLALAAVAMRLDPAAVMAADPARKATKDPAWLAATKARKVAIYILNTALGMRQSAIARAAGVTRQTVSITAREIEDERDDAATGPIVARLEEWIVGGAA